jgi:hypothetical protein
LYCSGQFVTREGFASALPTQSPRTSGFVPSPVLSRPAAYRTVARLCTPAVLPGFYLPVCPVWAQLFDVCILLASRFAHAISTAGSALLSHAVQLTCSHCVRRFPPSTYPYPVSSTSHGVTKVLTVRCCCCIDCSYCAERMRASPSVCHCMWVESCLEYMYYRFPHVDDLELRVRSHKSLSTWLSFRTIRASQRPYTTGKPVVPHAPAAESCVLLHNITTPLVEASTTAQRRAIAHHLIPRGCVEGIYMGCVWVVVCAVVIVVCCRVIDLAFIQALAVGNHQYPSIHPASASSGS